MKGTIFVFLDFSNKHSLKNANTSILKDSKIFYRVIFSGCWAQYLRTFILMNFNIWDSGTEDCVLRPKPALHDCLSFLCHTWHFLHLSMWQRSSACLAILHATPLPVSLRSLTVVTFLYCGLPLLLSMKQILKSRPDCCSAPPPLPYQLLSFFF